MPTQNVEKKTFNIWMMNQEELCRYQKFKQLTKRSTKQIPEPISSKVICIDYINLIKRSSIHFHYLMIHNMQLQQHYKMTPVSINWTPFISLLMQYQRACLEQVIAIPLVHKFPQFYQAMLWHNTLKSYNTYENTGGLPPRTLYLSSP